MASGPSYTSDQIQRFRQIYRDRCDSPEEGLRLEAFSGAVEACIHSAGLSDPPPHHLDSEFRRLSTTGTVSWQQFFQVRACREGWWAMYGYLTSYIAQQCVGM